MNLKDIDVLDTITLDNHVDYVVAGKAKYDDVDYLFLIDTEEYALKFAALADDQLLILDNKKDKGVMEKLFPLFLESAANKYTELSFDENK